MNAEFNVFDYQPNQGTPKHPVGKFSARISNTELKPFGDKPGANAKGTNLEVEFTSDQGRIIKRYGIFSDNTEQQRIAREQLAALCYAVGLQRPPTIAQSCAELRNGLCVIEVREQANNANYNEVATVYDQRGELPKPGNVVHGASASPPTNPAMGQSFGAGAPNPSAATGFQPAPFNPAPGPAPFQPQPMTMPPANGGTAPAFNQPGGAMPQAQPQWANQQPQQGQPPQQPAWAQPQR